MCYNRDNKLAHILMALVQTDQSHFVRILGYEGLYVYLSFYFIFLTSTWLFFEHRSGMENILAKTDNEHQFTVTH